MLAYFDQLLTAWHAGRSGRAAHLGYWPGGAATMSDGDDFREAQRRLDDLVVAESQLRNGMAILDVACGFGGLIERLNEQFDDVQLTGINIDARQLDVCQRLRPRGANRMAWIEGDACDLPIPDQSIDRVFCVEAMFHFASRRTFLAEVRRVLRPGGCCVMTDLRLVPATTQSVMPRFAIAALLNEGYGPWPDPWCRNGDAASNCRQLGFSDVIVRDLTAETRPTWNLISPRSWNWDDDPGDAVSRSGLMLRWLHEHGQLVCELVSAIRGNE